MIPQEKELQLNKLAARIIDSRLAGPAIFFLEAHLPFTQIFHTSTLFFAPIATPLFGAERMVNLQSLLAQRENVERLIELIEEKASAQ